MEKAKLLDRAASGGEERMLLAKVLDKLEQARERNIPACTDFLSPQEAASVRVLLRLAGAGQQEVLFFGGYEGAERQAALFLPDWLETVDAVGQFPFRYLRAAFRPEYQLTHRDLLGSLMGMGIVREKVGDLLVSENGCDLIVLDSVAQFLLQSWTDAGRARLAVSEIGPEDLRIPQARCEEVRDTVQTLRLDAVAATGFRLSRSKAAALIESGKVQVNWSDCLKPDRLLEQGDVVTARGLGKMELQEVGGVTRKGRTGIVIRRYL